MSPKRTDEISIKLRHEAKVIYDRLPKKGKGEYVSDAIIAKAQNSASLEQHIRDMEARLEKVERIIEGREKG
jgi:hypothetical protein